MAMKNNVLNRLYAQRNTLVTLKATLEAQHERDHAAFMRLTTRLANNGQEEVEELEALDIGLLEMAIEDQDALIDYVQSAM